MSGDMGKNVGASAEPTGLSSSTEPVSAVSALRASIPSALGERRAISAYLRTLTVRGYLNMQKVPAWRVLTIMRHKWMMAAYALAAESIERGEQYGTQEGWLVTLEGGVFLAVEGRQVVAASGIGAQSDETPAEAAQPARQEPGPQRDAPTSDPQP